MTFPSPFIRLAEFNSGKTRYSIWARTTAKEYGENGFKSEDLLEKRLNRLQKLLPLRQKPTGSDGSLGADGSVAAGSLSGLMSTFKGAVSRSTRAGGSHHGSSTMSKSFVGASLLNPQPLSFLPDLAVVSTDGPTAQLRIAVGLTAPCGPADGVMYTTRKVIVFNVDGKERRLREDDLIKMLKDDVKRAVANANMAGACAAEAGDEDPTAVLVRSLLVACGEVRGERWRPPAMRLRLQHVSLRSVAGAVLSGARAPGVLSSSANRADCALQSQWEYVNQNGVVIDDPVHAKEHHHTTCDSRARAKRITTERSPDLLRHILFTCLPPVIDHPLTFATGSSCLAGVKVRPAGSGLRAELGRVVPRATPTSPPQS